jgi:hypothetical protein
MSLSSLSRLTKKFNWSWKIPTVFQIQKYKEENLFRYVHYLIEVFYCKKINYHLGEKNTHGKTQVS